MIRIRQLQALEVVLMHATLTAAAEAFHITQPAMSRLITQLEEEVGFVVIKRSDGQIRLTTKGQTFWEEAKQVLSAFRAMTTCAERLRSSATIRILTLPGLVDLFIATPIAAFCVRHPEVKISLEVINRTELERVLATENYDLVLTVLPVKASSDYETTVLTSLKAQCVFPSDHVLGKQAEVHASDLLAYPFLSLREGSVLRRRVDETFEQFNLQRNMRVECQSQDVVCEMVAAGMGVSILLPNGIRPNRYGLTVRPFVPEITMEYAMLRSATNRNDKNLDELATMIMKEI